jgi:hypothetical protein
MGNHVGFSFVDDAETVAMENVSRDGIPENERCSNRSAHGRTVACATGGVIDTVSTRAR